MRLSFRAVVIALAAVAGAGCQTYDFEPVVPLAVAQTTQARTIIARQQKPDMMILLDKSGSMAAPIDPGNPNCPASSCPGPSCPANCPTRISELRNAMNTFLSGNGNVARMGLTSYPTNATCGQPDAMGNPPAPCLVQEDLSQSNDVDSELQQKATAINQKIQGIGITGTSPAGSPTEVGGGTPTGPSLTFLGDYAALQDPNRADFILLLTDGLPNCNPGNSNNCLNAGACRCTTTNCGTDTSAPFCTLGCLDQSGSVQAVADLRSKDIRTIVVGFGADTGAGDGPLVLNAMAEAGGFARGCPNGTNTECGSNNTCDQTTKICTKKFYQATNASELAAALADISNLIKNTNICEFVLESTPTDERFISVIFNGQALTRDDTSTWTYTKVGGDKVVVLGQYCNDLKSSTAQNPVKIEIRVVETF
jgi:hypothetical protein